MHTKLKQRHDVLEQLTWDLTSMFIHEQDLIETLAELQLKVDACKTAYWKKLNNTNDIIDCLKDWMSLMTLATKCVTYTHLNLSTNQTNNENAKLANNVSSSVSRMMSDLSFIESELGQCEVDVLNQVKDKSPELIVFIDDLLRSKNHRLHPEVEKTLLALAPVLDSFYPIYNRSKLADLQFQPFNVNGIEHDLSFVRYENELEFETHHDVRHQAFNSFSHQLSKYQHTMAATYQSHIKKEKLISIMRNHESVFDYLLFNQKVSKDMYHRQIDLIMTDLAPIMRKYAKLIQNVHGLESMTFADLKLPLDPDFEPDITIDEAKSVIKAGLSSLGEDYLEMVDLAFDNRWIDFEQNIGKSTGAFCSSPYGVHPYILISWTQRMRECFVLAHELGHAGHFYFAHQHQNILNSRPSLYFIEAPSTMNELLVAQTLKLKSNDLRMKRWVLSTIISRTYYHNFVTHLLEAAFQREVYNIIDQGGSIVADTLSSITLDILKSFWGDQVEIQDEAKYIWMRQPHYYMGLYSYTYSAGLTIATQAHRKITEDPSYIKQWKSVLNAGGTKTPQELSMMMDIDLTSEQPLKETIQAIGDMVDEMIELTNEIEKNSQV
jgi:oligoendopeptidase F